MSVVDLCGELLVAQQMLDAEDKRRLHAAGVPDHVVRWGWVGALHAIVEPIGHRSARHWIWQHHDKGARVVVVPVKVAEIDAITPEWSEPEEVLRYGHIVDLIAFSLERPERWALRSGAALWLGAIEPQLFTPHAVNVRGTPLDWLRAGGDGICCLSADDRDIRSVLMGCGSLVVEDVRYGMKLRGILERPSTIPSIFVRHREFGAAA